jgi:hypothetical protein
MSAAGGVPAAVVLVTDPWQSALATAASFGFSTVPADSRSPPTMASSISRADADAAIRRSMALEEQAEKGHSAAHG